MKQLFLLFPLLAFSIITYSQSADTAKTPSELITNQPDTGLIYTFAEVMPKFPGGDAALLKFIHRNVTCPSAEECVGKVTVRFVVNREGLVENAEVLHSYSPALGAEVLKVIQMLPRFEPGRQNGKPVRVYYNLPILIN